MDGINFGSSDSIDGANSVTNLAMTLLNNSLDNHTTGHRLSHSMHFLTLLV